MPVRLKDEVSLAHSILHRTIVELSVKAQPGLDREHSRWMVHLGPANIDFG